MGFPLSYLVNQDSPQACIDQPETLLLYSKLCYT